MQKANKDTARARAKEIADRHLARGDAVGWFEELYSTAEGNLELVPWADRRPNVHLKEWLKRAKPPRKGETALVVGCGLGDDAESLARFGFEVTAFDISPSAIEWARNRFPDSAVHYRAADLFNPPNEWRGGFDFVFESYTVQALPQDKRHEALEAVVRLVAPNGRLLIITRVRLESEPPSTFPWPLTREEVGHVEMSGLRLDLWEEFYDDEQPPVRRGRGLFYRQVQGD